MKYRVVLIEDEEGYAVGCPALPGCWTQGDSREEALANIRTAIQEVLEVQAELEADAEVRSLRLDGLHVETQDLEFAIHA
jgi:predicted RNase H-like HicB family nuclease